MHKLLFHIFQFLHLFIYKQFGTGKRTQPSFVEIWTSRTIQIALKIFRSSIIGSIWFPLTKKRRNPALESKSSRFRPKMENELLFATICSPKNDQKKPISAGCMKFVLKKHLGFLKHFQMSFFSPRIGSWKTFQVLNFQRF